MTEIICYSCNQPITKENESDEHVINNSLGGRLKSPRLLCVSCNSSYGETIDAELEQQIGMFTDHLGIKKQRNGSSPRLKMVAEDGEVKYVSSKLKPLTRLKFGMPNKDVVLFVDEGKYEKIKNGMQKDLDKKFKTVYAEYTELPTKKQWFVSNKLSKEPGHIEFGGREFFRSLAKIALNYYFFKNYDPQYSQSVVDFVKGNKEENIVHFFYPNNQIIHDLKPDEVSHIIHIKGSRQYKVLYAYIELFNMQNVIVLFNMEYDGEDFSDTYCYDLLNSEEIAKTIKIRLTRNHFEVLHLISPDGVIEHNNKYNRVLKIIEKRQLL